MHLQELGFRNSPRTISYSNNLSAGLRARHCSLLNPRLPHSARTAAMAAPKRICFSDIDGTIMHLPVPGMERDEEILVTPPSTSGRTGAISARTLHQVAALRSKGVMFVVITGARLSTLLMRLPYLPAADAFVCENGGRIFYPGGPLPTACPVTEDTAWREQQAAAGPAQQDAVPPAERQGLLWQWYAQLQQQGWVLDANGYTTSFRIHAKGGKSLEELHQLITTAPEGLHCTFNIGAADFYPATSGKIEAARYLMQRFGATAEDSVFLCDDDNDMPLAAVVGKAFLPTTTSDSVRKARAERPEHFVSATKEGTDATEEMLDAVAVHYGLPAL